MKVYKVVKKHTNCSCGKCYTSAITKDHALRYKIGRETTPKFGKLFGFKTIREAREFAKASLGTRVILEGTTTYAREGTQAMFFDEPEKFKKFWDTKYPGGTAPFGTYYLDNFTPRRVVGEDEVDKEEENPWIPIKEWEESMEGEELCTLENTKLGDWFKLEHEYTKDPYAQRVSIVGTPYLVHIKGNYWGRCTNAEFKQWKAKKLSSITIKDNKVLEYEVEDNWNPENLVGWEFLIQSGEAFVILANSGGKLTWNYLGTNAYRKPSKDIQARCTTLKKFLTDFCSSITHARKRKESCSCQDDYCI